jgi:hypothetical protein
MYPKIYYESKIKTGFRVLLVLLLMFAIPFYKEIGSPQSIYLTQFPIYLLVFIVVFGIIFYLLPSGILEIYPDHFVYRKGKFEISALWSEVERITFQKGMARGTSGAPHSFFIVTQKGKTKLIDFSILATKNSSFNSKEFFDELKNLFGKEFTIGDYNLETYGYYVCN